MIQRYKFAEVFQYKAITVGMEDLVPSSGK